jgi:hypothetical protein
MGQPPVQHPAMQGTDGRERLAVVDALLTSVPNGPPETSKKMIVMRGRRVSGFGLAAGRFCDGSKGSCSDSAILI